MSAERQVLFDQNKAIYEAKWGKGYLIYIGTKLMMIRQLLRRILYKALTKIDPSPASSSQFAESTNQIDIAESSNEFYLDESSVFTVTGTSVYADIPRWMQIQHCEDKRTSIILTSEENLELSQSVLIDKDTRIFIRYSAALPNISADGLTCEIYFSEPDKEKAVDPICILPISGGRQSPYWRSIEFDASALKGQRGNIIVACRPGPNGESSNDSLAISDLCIAREDRLPILKARSFHELRARNEIEHFSSVYRHSMYSTMQNKHAENAAAGYRPIRKLESSANSPNDNPINNDVIDLKPVSGESPYGYAARLLSACIPQSPPNFVERLKSMTEGGRIIKVLSLCSGAARIEASYSSQVGPNVEWSLLDINVDLLGLASMQFNSGIKLDLIEANVNDLVSSGEKWDVILCVSALHHIVELEKLIKFCHASLNENGEFWSIGEYVGKNGNRLWPDAREEANKIFRKLPERYRFNRHTNQLDHEIPDNDYSVGCFEGIRSENIEPVLDRWFQPVDVYRRNCFLWRLTNLAYSDNYDIMALEDQEWIKHMVMAEAHHFQTGGRGTELFGVYRPRLLSKTMQSHHRGSS